MFRFISFAIFIISVAGCSHSSNFTSPANNSERLSGAILALSNSISPAEATQTSKLLLSATSELAQEYKMVRPAKYHNILVKLGLRRRGLCCHWAEDLHRRLRTIDPQSIKFDWVVARHGSQLREHNSVVVYAANSTWQQGLVFDPWRKAGQPYWILIERDKYPWHPHPLSGEWDLLHCK